MEISKFKRQNALKQICQITRCGTVDGVEFDFRAEGIDPAEWGMPLLGCDDEWISRNHDAPFIWFPWYGKFDRKKTIAEKKFRYNNMSDFPAASTEDIKDIIRHVYSRYYRIFRRQNIYQKYI